MQLLFAVFLPWICFLRMRRPFSAVTCLVMQLCVIGWPFASIWALNGYRHYRRDEQIWAQVERRYVRVACGGAPAALLFADEAQAVPGRLADLSLSGAAVTVSHAGAKTVGSPVVIQLPGAEFAVTGHVVRATPDGVAIEFRPDRRELEVIRGVLDRFATA